MIHAIFKMFPAYPFKFLVRILCMAGCATDFKYITYNRQKRTVRFAENCQLSGGQRQKLRIK